jgi:hypothetical protein
LIVALSANIVILEILLSVEGNLLGLHFSVFHIDLVADKHNWDVLAYSDEILVPFWHILIGDSGADIEHDYSAISSNTIF